MKTIRDSDKMPFKRFNLFTGKVEETSYTARFERKQQKTLLRDVASW